MSIFEVEHQARAHRIIQQALASRRMPHAYLFAGPEGVGREMLALRLAQVLLCAGPLRRPLPQDVCSGAADPILTDGQGLDACDVCQDCQLVAAGTHPDLFLIHRQLNRQHPDATIRKQKALVLGVDVIRHFLVDRVGLRPNRGRAKVFVVREAERLNEAAQNALLKTLEEPPPDTFLILITVAMEHLLPTTRSRGQAVVFQPLPSAYVAERLGALRPTANFDEIKYVATRAGGRLGLALRQIDDGLPALKRAWGDRLVELTQAGPGFAPHSLAGPFTDDAEALGKLAAGRDPDISQTDATRLGVQTLLAVLADFYVDAQRRAAGAGMPLLNADQPQVVDRLAAGRDAESLAADLQHLRDADAQLARNVNLDLTIETLFIRLARSVRNRGSQRPAGSLA